MKIVIKVVTNCFVVYVFFWDSVLWITTSASNRTRGCDIVHNLDDPKQPVHPASASEVTNLLILVRSFRMLH